MFLPQKRSKGAKVGRAVGKNQLFCILLNIGSLDIFDILQETIKGYKLTLNRFLRKILILKMLAIFGHFWLKNTLSCILLNIGTLYFFSYFLSFFFFFSFLSLFFFLFFCFLFLLLFFILFSLSKVL